MKLLIPSNNLQFALYLTLQTSRTSKLRVVTYDRDKPFTKYTDRFVGVGGNNSNPRTIYLTFPQSPKWLVMMITNEDKTVGDAGFKLIGYPTPKGSLIPYKIIQLRKCDVWMDEETRNFADFAQLFSKNAGFLQTNPPNDFYADSTGKFHIDFQDFIIDKQTKTLVNTPARVGHTTGIIHVSKQIFKDYTVPQRFIILLHEFSHKYINPKFGKNIENEFAADINALYVYLGLGYPPIDARLVYLNVFNQQGVNPDLSLKRYQYIDDFITKFDSNKFSKCNTNYNTKK